jgi:putative ABC transport system permease protein
MFQHNLLLIYRNFKRFKTTFCINLIGLSTGLTCTLLIYLWVDDELHIGRYFENDSRIFQVMQNTSGTNGIETIEATPSLLAKALADEIPEVEYSVAVIPPAFNASRGTVTIGDTKMKTTGQYVTTDFFHVFPYKLIHGDRNRVLSDKKGVILSEELALKLFNTVENVVGKTLTWEAQNIIGLYFISGIFEAPEKGPRQFDILLNYQLFEDVNPSEGWGNSSPRTYVLLKDGVSLNEFNDKIEGFIKSKDRDLKSTLFLQRYSDRYLYGHFENGIQAGGRIQYVKLFSIVGIFILVIACINFMNLSTAKASRRIKDVGIKKAVGAARRTLVVQYLSESMFITFLSLIVAILLVDVLIIPFNTLTGKDLNLTFDAQLMLTALGVAVVTGLLSGSYPAFYLSGFKAACVLKGRVHTLVGDVWARKALVIFQFVISVILIISVWVIYRQMEFVHSKNLGYTRHHIIYFDTPKMTKAFMADIKNISGVLNAGGGRIEAGGILGGTNDVQWEGKGPEDNIFFSNLWLSYNLIETLGMQLVAGRSFSEDFGSHDQIIFNEEAIERMGLKDPIGKRVTIGGEERQIVGVVKNFHFESLYEEVKPCVLLVAPLEYAPKISVKIHAGTESVTIENLQKVYQKHNPGQPFDFKFMDDDYDRLYASEQQVSSLTKYFAGLAILISCLGLLGLAAFTAERRLKEIGIRKILGSSVFGIVYLLSADFTKIVFVAIVIALPAGYFITKHWLDSFAFKIELEWWYFIGAGLIALIIAWLTVASQAIKAASTNPVKHLRNE